MNITKLFSCLIISTALLGLLSAQDAQQDSLGVSVADSSGTNADHWLICIF
jgi:hypothetical protein